MQRATPCRGRRHAEGHAMQRATPCRGQCHAEGTAMQRATPCRGQLCLSCAESTHQQHALESFKRATPLVLQVDSTESNADCVLGLYFIQVSDAAFKPPYRTTLTSQRPLLQWASLEAQPDMPSTQQRGPRSTSTASLSSSVAISVEIRTESWSGRMVHQLWV